MKTRNNWQPAHKIKILCAVSAIAGYMLTAVPMYAQTASTEQAPCKGCTHKDGKDANLLQKDLSPSPDPTAGMQDEPPVAPDRRQSPRLQSGTDSTMLKTGTDSTMLQTGTDSTTLSVGAQNTMIQAGVERKAEQVNLLILVDCSRSMKDGLGGMLSGDHEEKMNAAKTVLERTIAEIPSDVNIGLRVFGQSFHNDPYLDCQQTALLVPIGNHNRRTIIEKVRQIKPFGLTPLTYGLREAANDLARLPGRKQLVLISDGAETCGYDPCMEVRRITASGINIKIDIVGLGLRRDWEAKAQLNCIASQTGGKFFDANTAAELIDSLKDTVKQAVGGESRVSGKVITKFKPTDTPAPADLPADLR